MHSSAPQLCCCRCDAPLEHLAPAACHHEDLKVELASQVGCTASRLQIAEALAGERDDLPSSSRRVDTRSLCSKPAPPSGRVTFLHAFGIRRIQKSILKHHPTNTSTFEIDGFPATDPREKMAMRAPLLVLVCFTVGAESFSTPAMSLMGAPVSRTSRRDLGRSAAPCSLKMQEEASKASGTLLSRRTAAWVLAASTVGAFRAYAEEPAASPAASPAAAPEAGSGVCNKMLGCEIKGPLAPPKRVFKDIFEEVRPGIDLEQNGRESMA